MKAETRKNSTENKEKPYWFTDYRVIKNITEKD